jgi:exosortase
MTSAEAHALESRTSNRIAAIAAGLALCVAYWETLIGVVVSWSSSNEMSHGYFVVPLAMALLWDKRKQWLPLPVRSGRFALAALGASLVLHYVASAIQNQFLCAFALALTITFGLAYLYGWRKLRAMSAPLSLLLFAIQPPVLLYEWLTLPLQRFASASGEIVLDTLGYTVLRQGNVLHLSGFTLSVADACSGLASLYSMLFLSSCCIVLSGRRPRFTAAMLLAAVVASLVTNAVRIVVTAILGLQNHEWTQGKVHESVGLVTFVFGALLVLAAFSWLYRQEARQIGH